MKRARAPLVAALLTATAVVGRAQEPVQYRVQVEDPGSRLYHVEATLPTTGDVTLVSLPSWTPGHYKLENYARFVRHFAAVDGQSGAPLRWDKADKDTWRIVSRGASRVRVSFDYLAEEVGLSQSLLREDFGFFNGTNLFVFPETGYDFPAVVTFDLPAGWKVATELADGDEPGTFRARDYHELVDNPTFLGHFGIDSTLVDNTWIRLAVYPEDRFREPAKGMALEALGKMATLMHEWFGGPPYDRYTTLIYLAQEQILFFGGLEHAESHFDILPVVAFERPEFTFRSFLYRLLSHEYYHAWNVKRIRPVQLWPYAYDREQYTPLLWVSEGITDYYAHVILVRTGLWSDEAFWEAMREAIDNIERQPAHEAVEDASLNSWIEPVFISENYYYDKGALLGLLLDIRIRDATNNRHSLDDVMAKLYRERFQRDRGFTTDDFLGYVSEYLGDDFTESFYRRYVDGREPLPFRETFERAGMGFSSDTIVEPFFGVALGRAQDGMRIRSVEPGSEAARAGLQPGDLLERVGSVEVTDGDWARAFRSTYGDSTGVEVAVAFRRGREDQATRARIGQRTRYQHRLQPLDDASPDQRALRRGLLTGEPGGRIDAGTSPAREPRP